MRTVTVFGGGRRRRRTVSAEAYRTRGTACWLVHLNGSGGVRGGILLRHIFELARWTPSEKAWCSGEEDGGKHIHPRATTQVGTLLPLPTLVSPPHLLPPSRRTGGTRLRRRVSRTCLLVLEAMREEEGWVQYPKTHISPLPFGTLISNPNAVQRQGH